MPDISTAAEGAAAGSVAGPWGALGGAAIGAIGGILGQSSANRAQMETANRQMDLQTYYRATAYQTAVEDMKKAGLNPMLAYDQGGAKAGSPVPQPNIQSTIGPEVQRNIAQAATSAAQIANINADTKVKETQAREVEARIPTYATTIDQMRQQIEQSKAEAQKAIDQAALARQETATSAARAQLLAQEATNLKESVAQIRATVNNLRAQTTQTIALTGLTIQETNLMRQKVEAALPNLERITRQLEITIQQMTLPGLQNQQMAKESFVGLMGAYLRELTGLGQVVPTVRATTINK